MQGSERKNEIGQGTNQRLEMPRSLPLRGLFLSAHQMPNVFIIPSSTTICILSTLITQKRDIGRLVGTDLYKGLDSDIHELKFVS
jgi:hypothetical protein